MNKRKNDYYNEHRKLLTPILEKTKNMTEQEGEEYIKSLRPLQRKIFNRYRELYKDYKYSLNEIYARQAGKKAVERYLNEKENHRLDGRGQTRISSFMGRPQERNLGTGYWNSSQRGSQENQRLFKEETEELKKHIPNDIDEILPKVKPPKDNLADRVGGVISTRADIINPKIKHALRRFEFESGMNENKYTKDVKGFITKLDFMTPSDYAKYDLALKNGNKEVINTLNSKYNLGEDYTKVRSVLDNIRNEALNVGMNIGFIDEYFPRKIINASAILDEYSKSTYLKKMLRDVDPNNVLSPEDKIEKLNNFDGKKYF